MAPNHGGEHLGSILGPMGSHWEQKMGQNRKKLPCPKIRIFDYSAVIDLGKKIEFTVMAPNHGGDPLGSILRSMGSHWGQKNGSKPSKSTMPKNSNFLLLRGHRFGQKIEFTVMAPNHGGDPLGSILGPMGSHWGQKIGQNRKKLPCPKTRIFYYSAVIDLGKNRIYGYGAKSRWGTPGVHLGANWGLIGNKKWVKTVNNYHAPKFEILTTPRSSIWAKNRIYGYGAKSRWGPPRVHLGANGVPLGQKNGSKP